MAQVHVPGGVVAPPAAVRPRRTHAAEVVEAVVIGILLIATIVFGYAWTQAQSSLSTAQRSVDASAAVATYGVTYLAGLQPVETAVVGLNGAVATGDLGTVGPAAAELQTSLSVLGTKVSGVQVPDAVATAQSEFTQGSSLVAAGASMVEAGVASSDWGMIYEGKAMVDQGWGHLDTGRSWVYTALRSTAQGS